MLLFHYHPETGADLGSSRARPDPLELQIAQAAVRDSLAQAASARLAAALEAAGEDNQAITAAHARGSDDLAAADAAAQAVEPTVWLIPAHSTTDQPPAFGFDEQAVMTAEGWAVRPSVETPEDIPAPEDLAAAARQTRDLLIEQDRWLIQRHRDQLDMDGGTTLSPAEYLALLEYQQALRDVPQQSGFPLAIDWPTRPDLPIS